VSDHEWAYKQLDAGVRAVVDVNTKPLHVEIERLRAECARQASVLDRADTLLKRSLDAACEVYGSTGMQKYKDLAEELTLLLSGAARDPTHD